MDALIIYNWLAFLILAITGMFFFFVGKHSALGQIEDVNTIYKKIKDGNVFACDVDDTLIMWGDPKFYPGKVVTITTNGFPEKGAVNEFALEHLKKMKRRGYAVVVWSAGGSDWAEAVVKALEIERYVDLVMPKIDDHLDDTEDPVDKIGRWAYIDPNGNVKRKNLKGEIKTWTIKKGEDFHGAKN